MPFKFSRRQFVRFTQYDDIKHESLHVYIPLKGNREQLNNLEEDLKKFKKLGEMYELTWNVLEYEVDVFIRYNQTGYDMNHVKLDGYFDYEKAEEMARSAAVQCTIYLSRDNQKLPDDFVRHDGPLVDDKDKVFVYWKEFNVYIRWNFNEADLICVSQDMRKLFGEELNWDVRIPLAELPRRAVKIDAKTRYYDMIRDSKTRFFEEAMMDLLAGGGIGEFMSKPEDVSFEL